MIFLIFNFQLELAINTALSTTYLPQEELNLFFINENLSFQLSRIFIENDLFLSMQLSLMRKVKKEEGSSEDQQPLQDPSLISLRAWMGGVEPIKLVKLSQDMMTSLLENWSKFRITVLKTLNQQENKVLDCMAILRKEVQWLNQIKLGQTPQLNKITSRLFKQCQELQQKQIKFELKNMLKQSKLVCDKLLDSVKSVFQTIKEKVVSLVQSFKQYTTISEILTEKTYFKFLQKKHHSEVQLISDTAVTVHNQSHDLDFGAVIGPSLTQSNYRVAIRIQQNDRYQSFIGVGVCHPDIVKQKYFKGSGIDSGCYIIRQESDPQHTLSLSHAYEKDGTHKKTKQVPWGFGQGDVILIQMDYKRKMVCFSKGDEYYEMKVDLDQGSVNPYVVLHSKWDSVSVVNQ